MEHLHTTHAHPDEYAMDLAVTLEDGGIRVAAGTVVLEGQTEQVAQEIVTIASRPLDAVVFGYLAREHSTGALVLLVDEHVQDGIDEAYVFDREGPYGLLAYLFRVTVPASTTDLRGLDYDRWRIASQEVS